MPPRTTCQFVRKYMVIWHFWSGGIVFGSIWNCCAVNKSDVHTSILSAVSNNFYHHKPYETDLPSPCKAYHNKTRRFVG